MKISKSPDRNTFQKERYLERKAQEGRTPENDPDVRAMAEYYDSWNIETQNKESDPGWLENNLEADLRSTDWMLEKVRLSEDYAQNVYAALCNTEWQRNDVMPLLKGETWCCSWRYAGGIVADMRGSGDYIDWYCSGIKGGHSSDADDQIRGPRDRDYVSEGHVTQEVKQDFFQLGWILVETNDPE